MTNKGKKSKTNNKERHELPKESDSKEDGESVPDIENKTADEEGIFPIVGIGASAGGLDALEKFFTNMPSDSRVAFVVVMHFDPTGKSIMADILKKYTNMEVFQVDDGMRIRQNCVYIIPPNKDMAILHRTLHLYEPVVHRGVRHPIDFFFRSLSDDQKEYAICIVLSGTGTEGTLGLRAIKGEGGAVMVQSIESAAYDGMPRSAIATGLVDFILPPEKMPEQLLNYVKQFYATGIRPEKIVSEQITNYLQKIIILIRNQTGLDFSQYKQSTLIRRIDRRMNLHQISRISDYVRYLQENPAEIQILHKEFLIGVTSFFREPEAFKALKEEVVPEIFKNKTPDQTVRIWVPACSTGEEAYSLAIILKEYMDETKSDIKAQIFATDVDREAIEAARTGVYPENIALDVSPERLSRFFIKNSDSYNVNKDIREMVVFAPQNVISDPPFLRMDLISCRNLMIYLVPEVQKKLLLIFQYSLNQDGFLFIGSSETIGESTDLYSPVDKKWKLFKRKGERTPLLPVPGVIPSALRVEVPGRGEIKTRPVNIGELIEKMLLDTYTPPSVIVNEKGDILYIHGRTGKYLEPASGRPSLNVREMARQGIRTELNIALHTVVTQKKDAIFRNLNVKTNGSVQTINLTVRPINEPERLQGLIMVVFEDVPPREVPKPAELTSGSKQTEEYVTEMEKELKYTRENLQATIEELQTSNEELKSTNEELQSANEELQSTNEELNASKEELQSLNEELVTLNAEHQTKIDELSKSASDLSNVLISTEIATIFLDNSLIIKGFTPSANRIMNLIRTDIGRPISDIVLNLKDVDLAKDSDQVLDNLVFREKEVEDTRNKKRYLMRITPYRTIDNVIDGVVISFIDITRLKHAEMMLEQDYRVFTTSIIDTIREPLLVLDENLTIILANRSFYRMFKVSPDETESRFIYDLGYRQWDIPQLRKLLEEIVPKSTQFNDFRVEHDFPGIGQKVLLLNARRIYQEGKGTERILLAIEDITGRSQEKS
ncbi:MAG: PAS domain-containing protein [Candidatus Methanoperedens sp.]|nr:PAS domain-containing protein [Candidatus Methanoperedens sp.]